jgi:hypothetical protein
MATFLNTQSITIDEVPKLMSKVFVNGRPPGGLSNSNCPAVFFYRLTDRVYIVEIIKGKHHVRGIG